MNSEQTAPSSPDGEESWESLAEDLFGIDFETVPDSEPVELPDEPSPEAPLDEPQPVEEVDVMEDTVIVDEVAADWPNDADDGFGNGLLAADAADESDESDEVAGHRSNIEDDESKVKSADALDAEVEIAADNSLAADEEDDDEDESADEAAETSEDTYWDALNDWGWESENGGKADSAPDTKSGRGASRRKEPERARSKPSRAKKPDRKTEEDRPVVRERIVDDFATGADFRDEYVDDADFGVGLLDTDKVAADSTAESAPSKTGEAKDDATGASDSDKPKRRRRRRRRSRPETGDRQAQTEKADEPDDSQVNAGDESDEDVTSTDDEARSDPDDASVADDVQDGVKKPRRRRSPRRRGRRRESPAAAQADADDDSKSQETSQAQPDEELDDEVLGDEVLVDEVLVDEVLGDGDDSDNGEPSEPVESGGREKATYRNVPTWEEAISYLLNPSQVEGNKPAAPAASSAKATATKSGRDSSKSKPSGQRGRRRRR